MHAPSSNLRSDISLPRSVNRPASLLPIVFRRFQFRHTSLPILPNCASSNLCGPAQRGPAAHGTHCGIFAATSAHAPPVSHLSTKMSPKIIILIPSPSRTCDLPPPSQTVPLQFCAQLRKGKIRRAKLRRNKRHPRPLLFQLPFASCSFSSRSDVPSQDERNVALCVWLTHLGRSFSNQCRGIYPIEIRGCGGDSCANVVATLCAVSTGAHQLPPQRKKCMNGLL